jgi:hypothetical protein
MPWNGLWTADSAKCANSSRRALKLGRIDSPWPILLMLGNGLWTADSAKCETTSRSAYMAESAVHGPFSLSLSLFAWRGYIIKSLHRRKFLAD